MELGLKDKVAIVTGAGSQIGYGRGIAMTLAKEGCNIIAVDIDLVGAKKTAAEVIASGRQALAVKADVSNNTEIDDMVKIALVKFSKIDILVNNAGASTPPKPFIEMTETELERDININLKGVLYCTRAVLNHMISQKSGKINNISSSKVGGAGVAVYSAAKGGVMLFTKSLAAEVAKLGINVNSIAPGQGNTGFSLQVPPAFIERVLTRIPLGRSTTPQDIGNMVAFLASDASSDVVGQIISVDGGLTMV